MVVDDSVVVRRLLSRILSDDPALEVTDVAMNGRVALQKTAELNPDVITLDVDMPELDGLATLTELRRSWPTIPVIMFSALTEDTAATTLEALALGASDYVAKPSNTLDLTDAETRIRHELIPKIKAVAEKAAPRLERVLKTRKAAAMAPNAGQIELVVIGVSTGGPQALTEILSRLPADFAAPIVIAQHMPPLFTRYLAERLSARSPIRFQEGVTGQVLRPGEGWVAPGDFHLIFRREGPNVVLSLNQDPPENSCRPAADPMFRSAASICGSRVLGIVLTGMGHDGLRGCQDIKAAGGQVIAQDFASSVVWGMPGFVVNAGLADSVLPVGSIADEMVRRTGRRSPVPSDRI